MHQDSDSCDIDHSIRLWMRRISGHRTRPESVADLDDYLQYIQHLQKEVDVRQPYCTERIVAAAGEGKESETCCKTQVLMNSTLDNR